MEILAGQYHTTANCALHKNIETKGAKRSLRHTAMFASLCVSTTFGQPQADSKWLPEAPQLRLELPVPGG